MQWSLFRGGGGVLAGGGGGGGSPSQPSHHHPLASRIVAPKSHLSQGVVFLAPGAPFIAILFFFQLLLIMTPPLIKQLTKTFAVKRAPPDTPATDVVPRDVCCEI